MLILVYVLMDHQRVSFDLSCALQISSVLRKVPLSCGGLPFRVALGAFITRILAPKVWGAGEGLTQAASGAHVLIQPEKERCAHGLAIRPRIQVWKSDCNYVRQDRQEAFQRSR